MAPVTEEGKKAISLSPEKMIFSSEETILRPNGAVCILTPVSKYPDRTALIQRCLNLLLGEDVKDATVCHRETGQPYIPELPNIHVGLSYSGKYIAAIAALFPTAVDIQHTVQWDRSTIQGLCSRAEWESLQNAPDIDHAFTALWTGKEAVLKARGVGLENRTQVRLALEDPRWTRETWQFEDLNLSIAFPSEIIF